MTYRWPHNLLMLVVLGAYLFSLLGLPGVSVLCYGQSGHLAVEAYGTDCTAVTSADTDHEQHALVSTDSGEPECVDIVIQTEPASPRSAAGSAELMLLASMHAILPQLSIMPVTVNCFVRTAHELTLPSFNDTRLALRSVILLV